MSTSDNKHRSELRKAKMGFQKNDKFRMIAMVVGLAIILVGYQAIVHWGDNAKLGDSPRADVIEEEIVLPPIDFEILAEVKDDSSGDRVVLEPKPFEHLSKMAQALLPAHLSALGEPVFPFDDSAKCGAPYRLRGELLHARNVTRSAGGPSEYWCLLRTDSGEEFFYVSIRLPDQLFGNENYARADGYFFKNYTQKIDGERLTRPLIVGRMLAPSARLIAPTTTIDPVIMADVRDAGHGEFRDLDERAMWHLLNVAQATTADGRADDAGLSNAKWLDYNALSELAKSPELFHGQAFSFTGVVVDSWSETQPENSLRMNRLTNAYIRNPELGDHLIRVIAPGGFDLKPFDRNPEAWTGWFMQLWAYEDTKGAQRRTPVFVIAKVDAIDIEEAPYVGQIQYGFMGLFAAIALLMFALIRRDKKSADAASVAWKKRRNHRRGDIES
ncbi:MAG: hypothetical protein HN844_02465 [Planctomycetes bacterium]|mgnify:CR=1 FL=1|jgi:hypothetical protein|nr:hypothetical protein [Planctomycetota bacterium]